MKNKKIVVMSVVAFIFAGCASSINPLEKDEEKNNIAVTPHSSTTDKYVHKDDSAGNMKQIKDVIYYQKGKNSFEPEFEQITDNNIVQDDSLIDEELLPVILRKNKIDYLDITNKNLGGVIKLIMTQLDGIGLIVEPNINLNKQINMTIKDRNIYEALKDLVEYSGYGLTYNADKKSFVVSEYVSKHYYIPASIFIDRNAEVAFNSKSISPEFKSSLGQSVEELFKSNLANIGSAEKLITIDKQAGVVYIKERALYIKEIDSFVTEFVHNRTQQFNVELAVVQLNADKSNKFGLDLQNIVLEGANININSLAGGFPLASASATANPQTGTTMTATGGSVAQGTITSGNKISFNWLLGALDERGYDNVVTRPNVLVQNHSIGYLSVLDTQSYIKEWKQTILENSTIITTPVFDEYQEGMDFLVKLNKFPKKDYLQVSVVPNIKEVELSQIETTMGTMTMPRIKEISTFSVANIKSGDIIVLSGFKKKNSSVKANSPLISHIPIVGQAFKSETQVDAYTELVFLIKVTEISKPKETFNSPSNKSKELYRQFQ